LTQTNSCWYISCCYNRYSYTICCNNICLYNICWYTYILGGAVCGNGFPAKRCRAVYSI